MNQLIKLQPQTINGNAVETVNARELHEFLEVGRDFSNWNKVGRIANAHGLKTVEFGMLYLAKSQHSDKQVETWRYYDCAIDKFKSILETE